MKRKAGFTLIEVLVALVVAVAAMSLLAQGFTTGARASTTAQHATRAALLAQRSMRRRSASRIDKAGAGV